MTTPNLDALAKLGPFRIAYDDINDCDFLLGQGHAEVSTAELMAIANEWVELRAENARLRAGYEKAGMIDRPIARLTKFTGEESGPRVFGDDGGDPKELVGIDVAVALNDWLLLRAYRERMKAERSEMLRLLAYCRPRVQSYEQCNETYCANGSDHEVHKRIGELLDAAEGDPAPKEAT